MPDTKPEDIFSGLEQPAARRPAAQRTPKAPTPAPAVRPADQPAMPISHTRRLVIILILAGLLAGGTAAVILLTRYQPKNSNQANTADTKSGQATGTNSVDTGDDQATNEAPAAVDPIVVTPGATDSDADGLTDELEAQLGTKADNPDSDGDGLFDREETQYYKSDPNKADSDGDGHDDGEEVRGGYSPTGPGTLLDIPGTIESLTNSTS